MKAAIVKNSFILLIGLLVEWWLIWFSPLNLPERFSPFNFSGDTSAPSVKVSGLLLVGLILTVLIITLKRFLRANPDVSIFKLTILGTTVCLVAEIIFQTIRQPFLNADTFNDRLYYFLLGTFGVSIMGAAFSFFVAFQLKTKKTEQLILIIISFAIMMSILKHFFPILQ